MDFRNNYIKILVIGPSFKFHDSVSVKIVELCAKLPGAKYHHAVSLPIFATLQRNINSEEVKYMICDLGVAHYQTFPSVNAILYCINGTDLNDIDEFYVHDRGKDNTTGFDEKLDDLKNSILYIVDQRSKYTSDDPNMVGKNLDIAILFYNDAESNKLKLDSLLNSLNSTLNLDIATYFVSELEKFDSLVDNYLIRVTKSVLNLE
ncbi:MAG: hypothetical protein OEZ01_03850 [Candidatus Heimdallarchaeota archaeon]|nr:hypothetical protein [Candidatus Heimdallarchaeota archaeon]MDH5645113.1 hypothetical protein [Candidatus Heimdallarchaeota archaeon]